MPKNTLCTNISLGPRSGRKNHELAILFWEGLDMYVGNPPAAKKRKNETNNNSKAATPWAAARDKHFG